MDAYLTSAMRSQGFPGFTLRLTRRSQRRLVWVSFLPMLVVSAILIDLALSYAFDSLFLGAAGQSVPDAWSRLSAVSDTLRSFGMPLALAIFFAAGTQGWSRAEGSWMFLTGAVLAFLALGLGLASMLIYALEDIRDTQMWRPQTWTFIANELSFLAVGYFFVAYRAGALARAPRARVRRRRPA
ncbi:MAG TPA: hypothetical protein VFT91_02385 [Dehalococcoidia bacterium]|nr:hypothetical protein [Dehalococcoidia bacterium]